MAEAAPRKIPEELEDTIGGNRASFIEIAGRARVEQVNVYTVLCLGLHAYLAASSLVCAT